MNEQIKHTFFILHKCIINISNIKDYMYELMIVSNFKNHTVQLALTNYVILEVTSFIDEYEKKFIYKQNSKLNTRILEVKEICSPIMKKIKKWKDLGAYRNSIIAHPWYKNGKSTLPNFEDYNIPQNFIELVLLADYMRYIYVIINAEFNKELKNSIKTTKKKSKSSNRPSIDMEQLNKDKINLALQVEEKCIKYNKPYFLKVQQYKLT